MNAFRWRTYIPASLERDVALVLGFNLLFFLFLAIKPVSGTPLLAQILLIAGLITALFGICLRGLTGRVRREDWTALLVAGAGILLICGQIYEVYLIAGGKQPRTPSLADGFRLACYPIVLAAILSISARSLPGIVRTRILLDGLMFLAADIVFIWYFVIGPSQVPRASSVVQTLVADAYPFGDTLLVFSLAFFALQVREPELYVTIALFGLCFIVTAATDSVYRAQILADSYSPDSVVNVGWSLGWMFGFLGAWESRRILPNTQIAARIAETISAWSLWRSAHPYIFVPLVGALFLYSWFKDASSILTDGIAVGFGFLLSVVLVRHLLLEIENRRLYRDVIAANDRLATLATTDPVTGLPNQRLLTQAIDSEVERAKRFGRTFAILFCEIDNFKVLNDTSGQATGDAVLREFGSLVRRSIRATDVIGRWGGEDFLIVLPEIGSDLATTLAERLRRLIATQSLGSPAHWITCSMGVATYPTDGATRDAVIAAADLALDAAKTLGRNQVRSASDPAASQIGQLGSEGR